MIVSNGKIRQICFQCQPDYYFQVSFSKAEFMKLRETPGPFAMLNRAGHTAVDKAQMFPPSSR